MLDDNLKRNRKPRVQFLLSDKINKLDQDCLKLFVLIEVNFNLIRNDSM